MKQCHGHVTVQLLRENLQLSFGKKTSVRKTCYTQSYEIWSSA